MTEADPAAIVWALFTKLETVGDEGRDLPDPEVTSFLDAAEDAVGANGLLSGWALVAALLRQRLIRHADELGCDCGSISWLAEMQVHLANQPEQGGGIGRS